MKTIQYNIYEDKEKTLLYPIYRERHAKTEYDTLYVYDTRFYICHSLSIYLRGFMV